MFSVVFTMLMFQSAAEPIPEGVYSRASGSAAICEISSTSVAGVRDQVLEIEGIESIQQTELYETYLTDDGRRFWTFTKSDHSAFPAAICRTITGEDDDATLLMSIRCAAERDSCDQLYRDFTAHNETILDNAGDR